MTIADAEIIQIPIWPGCNDMKIKGNIMPLALEQEVIDLLNNDTTIKIIASIDGEGVPHIEVKQSLHLGSDGQIHLLEFHEYSTTSKNLVRSIWFNRPLAILLRGADGHCIQVKGRAVKNHISGSLFQQHYSRVRDEFGDIDLAGVWIVEPDEIIDQGYEQNPYSLASENPTYIHLDRIARA